MDADRFDTFVRSLAPRRTAITGMVGTGVAAVLARFAPDAAEARKKRRKKKKKCRGKKKRCGKKCCPRANCIDGACCPAGNVCGNGCCAPENCIGGACCPPDRVCGATCCEVGEGCIGGACCPSERVCGGVCCPAGQRCGRAATGTCIAGEGTCAAGADTCAANNLIFCNNSDMCVCVQATDGTTRCATPIQGITEEDCGRCATDADCAVQFPEILGVFCVRNATNICACAPGQNLCTAPCPAT